MEPYKSELLPLWSFKTEAAAEESVSALEERYTDYREAADFVGMDMARKYLQMGFTRAMRYAKYPGGRKYDEDGNYEGEKCPRCSSFLAEHEDRKSCGKCGYTKHS